VVILPYIENEAVYQRFDLTGGYGLAANTGASLVHAADHNAAFHTGAGGYFIFDNRGSDAGTVFWDATGGHGDDATALVKLPGMTSLMSSDFHLV